MLKISHADCLGLSPAISSQFSVEMCAASKNCEKFTKNLFLRGSRSFKVIDVPEVFEFCVLHMLRTLTISFLYLSCIVFILLSCLFVMSFFAAFLLCICEWIFNKLLSLVTPRKKLYLFVMGFKGQKSRTR